MAGPTADGWRIVSLWDSEADFERFRDERLAPALTGIGRGLPPFQIWPIQTVHGF
jgi:heme-degrading monooxygenase HmoA